MVLLLGTVNQIENGSDIVFFDNYGYAFQLKPKNLTSQNVTIPDPTPQNPELSYKTRTVETDYYKFNF